ncbi:MAG: hypothetical protein Q9193_001175 [Seirophora villosa]
MSSHCQKWLWQRLDETCEALSETCLAQLIRLVDGIHKELSASLYEISRTKESATASGGDDVLYEVQKVQQVKKLLLREPFARMVPGLMAVFENNLETRIKKLVAKVQIVFDMILSDFDNIFAITERLNAERSELRDSIKNFIHKAEAILKGPMKEELARAMKESD